MNVGGVGGKAMGGKHWAGVQDAEREGWGEPTVSSGPAFLFPLLFVLGFLVWLISAKEHLTGRGVKITRSLQG